MQSYWLMNDEYMLVLFRSAKVQREVADPMAAASGEEPKRPRSGSSNLEKILGGWAAQFLLFYK